MNTQVVKMIVFTLFIMVYCIPSSLLAATYSQSSGTNTVSGLTYSSTTADESSVKVTGGTFTMNNCTITKSGNTSDSDNSSFYGQNAAVLSSGSGSTIYMTGGTITTSATGANATVAYGGTLVVTDVTMNCSGNLSRGIHATNGGTITATNLTATTSGNNSSVIATDKGGGTVNVHGGTFAVSGTDAAVIYSTGTITANGISGTSEKGEIAVVEGSNYVTVTNNSNITAGSSLRGILMLQSGSGDAEGKVGYFTMTGGTLTTTSSSAPLVEVVTNSTGNITLDSVTTSIASGILMKVDYNTRWSTNGATGNLYLNGDIAYAGSIVADSYSTATLSILTGADLTGAINTANTGKLVKLTMDETSTLTLTANSYINGLITNPCISGTTVTNITGNGYVIYYTESTNTALGGLTYSLVNGGYLMPVSGADVENTPLNASDVDVYPVPFDNDLTVSFYLNESSAVRLSVIDLSGKVISVQPSVELSAGQQELTLINPVRQAGVCLLRLTVEQGSGNYTITKKIQKDTARIP